MGTVCLRPDVFLPIGGKIQTQNSMRKRKRVLIIEIKTFVLNLGNLNFPAKHAH